MFVLDRLRLTQDWKFTLPLYHRGHLSLYPGTTIYLAPVQRPGATLRHFPEVLGTTIQQNSWPTVYRVSVALHDAPGVLHSIVTSIARHGGNVLNLDSTSTDQESLHHVELVVDFASLVESQDVSRDLSSEIEGLLLADCYQHIVEEPGRGFGIRARPNTTLQRLDALLKKLRNTRFNSLIQEDTILKGGRFALREPLINMISTRPQEGNSFSLRLPLLYFISSDTRDRVFRITMIPDKRYVVWCSIRHNDRPGALSAITDEIRKQGVTILSALNRIQRHQGRGWFEVILSKEEWIHATDSRRKETREEVAALLAIPALKENYAPKVFFDKTEADEAMQREFQEDDAPPVAWFLTPQVGAREWLAEKESILGQPENDPNFNELEPSFQISRSALSLGIKKVRTARGLIRPTVFFSIEFSKTNDARVDIAAECCKKRGISYDLVRGTKHEPVVREEVLARISQATHFIGIWTPSEKDPGSNRCSPWLLWELGVASALRKPYGVVVEEGTNILDYSKIHGERFYFTFSKTPDDFRVQVEKCLDVVLRAHLLFDVPIL